MPAKQTKAKQNSKAPKRSGGRGSSSRGGTGKAWIVVARVLIWVLAVAAVVAALYFSGKGLHHLFFSGNPHFTLEHIELHITGRLTRPEVVEMLREGEEGWSIEAGTTNLFEIDPGRVREDLLHQKHGLINYLTIERRLPDRLRVCIYERQPVAWLGRRRELLIDAEGWVLPPRPVRRKNDQYLLDLPIITPVRNRGELSPFTRIDDRLVQACLDLFKVCLENSYGRWLDIRGVQLDYALEALHIFPAPSDTFVKNAEIIVPVDGMKGALRRVQTIVEERTRAEEPTRKIDATLRNNIPILRE